MRPVRKLSCPRVVRRGASPPASDAPPSEPIRLGLALPCRIYAEGLAVALSREPRFRVVGSALDSSSLRELLTRRAPQVLLLDLTFPEALSILHQLRAAGASCRVLLLCPTEYNPETLVKLLRAGAVGCFKPAWDLQLLKKALRAVARGEPWLDNPTMTVLLRDGHSTPSGLRLTRRERQILDHLRREHRNKEIAAALAISESTVKTHLHHLYRKLGITHRRQCQSVHLFPA